MRKLKLCVGVVIGEGNTYLTIEKINNENMDYV